MLIGLFLLRHHQRALARVAPRSIAAGPDRWAPFLVTTGVEIVRSVVFFGVNTFIELYWIHHLGASRGLAGAALACFLVGGVAGTLLGGRMADRIGLVRALRLGTVAMESRSGSRSASADARLAVSVIFESNPVFTGQDRGLAARGGQAAMPVGG